jgi:LacI family transcriptional regulator
LKFHAGGEKKMTPRIILMLEAIRSFDRGLLDGICKYSRLHGPWEFYLEPLTYRRPQDKKEAIFRLGKWNAKGIIAHVPYENAEKVLKLGLPMVVALHEVKHASNLGQIIGDNLTVGKMASEHFLNNGFRNFAYCGFDQMPWSEERGKSFAQNLSLLGYHVHFYEQPKSQTQRTWDKEQVFMIKWLKSLPKPVGILTCNDFRGSHIIEACRIAGFKVPDQIAVLGVDNDKLPCSLSTPPLSSVAWNSEKAGYDAAELLDKMMKGEKVGDHKIIVRPTHVEVRESSDITAIEDPLVADALRFIRQNVKKLIQVSDVADAVAVSRRSLEQRFRKSLGRSILDEIVGVRIEQVARMLVETNMSVWQIALTLGHPNTKNIARYFRRKMGMTPMQYRRRLGLK